METIRSLIQTVERVGDTKLRQEMLGKVSALGDRLARTHELLRATQAEVNGLRAHLARHTGRVGNSLSLHYDPPV